MYENFKIRFKLNLHTKYKLISIKYSGNTSIDQTRPLNTYLETRLVSEIEGIY